jgi:hypothetical protein
MREAAGELGAAGLARARLCRCFVYIPGTFDVNPLRTNFSGMQ